MPSTIWKQAVLLRVGRESNLHTKQQEKVLWMVATTASYYAPMAILMSAKAVMMLWNDLSKKKENPVYSSPYWAMVWEIIRIIRCKS